MITLTMQELEALLRQQKQVTAEYITRNMSVYSWFPEVTGDLRQMKEEIKSECLKSGFPDDFDVLKKYLKP